MNISLPDTLKSFVDEQVNQGSYGTSSEYVRELIRKDQDRLHLRGLLPHRRRHRLRYFDRQRNMYHDYRQCL